MPLWRMILTAINVVGVRFGGAAIGLLSQILLARLLPQHDVGVIFMGMSAAAILSLLVTAGYPPLAMTCLPRYHALGRRNLVEAFHSAFWRDSLVLTGIVILAVTAAVFFMPLDPGLKTAIIFGLLSSPASALIRINSAAANSIRRYTLSYVPDFLYRPGLLLLFLVLAWWAGLKLSVEAVLWAFVAANSIVALGQAWLIGLEGALPRKVERGARRLAGSLRGRAGALVIVAAVSGSFADLVNIIGGFHMPASEVAILGVSIRLAALAGFVTQATQNFVLPDLANALTRGSSGEIHTLLLRINAVALVAILGFILGAAVAGDHLLAIFGEEYKAGHWPLVLFMISQGFRAASGMNQHLLSLDGHQVKTASSCAFAVATLFAGASLLAPAHGVMGMAIAVVIADAVWAVLLAFQAGRYTGRRGDLPALLLTSP